MNLDVNCSLEDLLSDDDFIRHTFGKPAEPEGDSLHDMPDSLRQKLEQAQRILLGEMTDYRMGEQESRDLKNGIFDSLHLKRPG